MQTTCWTVGEYIFAQVASSALWFLCTAIGGLLVYKFRDKIRDAVRQAVAGKSPPDSPSGAPKCEKCGGLASWHPPATGPLCSLSGDLNADGPGVGGGGSGSHGGPSGDRQDRDG